MPPPTQSAIWTYFKLDEHDRDKSQCKICNKIYSRKGRTTTSLKNHLKSMHPEQYSAFCSNNEKQFQIKKDESVQKINLRESTRASTQKSRRRYKKKIGLDKKIGILGELDVGVEPSEVARTFEVSEAIVRQIRRRASEVRRQEKYHLAKLEAKKQATVAVTPEIDPLETMEEEYSADADDPSVEKMELLLWEWIERHSVSLDSPDVVFDKAQVFYNLIRNENNLGKVENPFKPTQGWYKVFREKYTTDNDNELPIEEDPPVENKSDAEDEHYKEKRHNSIKGNVKSEGEFYHELEDLFENNYVSLAAGFDPLDYNYGKTSRYEHFKTKRHNSITGNLRREGEFYHELEDLFDDEYDTLSANFHSFDFDYEDSSNYSLPLQERLQTNNKSESSPTPNSLPQENSNRSISPHNNEDDRDPDEVCLRWNSHHSNMKSSFPTLLEKEQYVDVTLCSEGQTIRCHRLILSSCSSYFDEILSGITPLQHPVIFLKGTPFWILKSLIDFMYVGEVHIEQAKLQEILEVAELLKIKGLTGKAPPQNSEPKEEVPKKQEKVIAPAPAQTTTKPVPRSVPPLRLAVTKEQAASMQTVDPLSLLKPSFYEESAPPRRQPIPIRPKYHHQSLAEFSAKQKEWLSKKIAPKKKFKRKSSDHDPSPPPVILRKGTKSRPIVKAPKYYHMEFEEKKDDKQVKCEDEEDPENPLAQNITPPSLLILPICSSTPVPPMPKLTPAPVEPAFDISNVKSEPIDMDIEENYVEYDPPATAATPLIRITEPRTVSADESNVFISNPNSPVPESEKDLEQNGVSPEEERQDIDKVNEHNDDATETENNEDVTEPDPEPEEHVKEVKPEKV